MNPELSLKGHFLLSMPHLHDGVFDNTLTFLCDHNEQGALGLVINQPSQVSLAELLEPLDLPASPYKEISEQPIYEGGPVGQERGFVLHSNSEQTWKACHAINEQLSLTTSLDILEAISQNKGPEHWLITLGYAGWGAGQLEQEIINNLWLSCPANLDILFHTPAEARLHAAATSIGINLDLMTSESGHA